MKKVLFAGESWISYSRHIKGFDSFFTAKYEEGIQWIKSPLKRQGTNFAIFPIHMQQRSFSYIRRTERI